MRVAILQSNYIPWKGYFDIIGSVDLFIFYDDLQYTKNDWRNRNRIKTKNGTKWITIPCGPSIHRLICEVQLTDSSWQKKHWSAISNSYQEAPFFKNYKDYFSDIYLHREWTSLSELNHSIIKYISHEILGFKTIFEDSRKYNLKKSKGDRVLELLKKVEAKQYISGPAAKSYLNEASFIDAGIELSWMKYDNYPEYIQLYPPFDHHVSIIDLLFNAGQDAHKFMLFP